MRHLLRLTVKAANRTRTRTMPLSFLLSPATVPALTEAFFSPALSPWRCWARRWNSLSWTSDSGEHALVTR